MKIPASCLRVLTVFVLVVVSACKTSAARVDSAVNEAEGGDVSRFTFFGRAEQTSASRPAAATMKALAESDARETCVGLYGGRATLTEKVGPALDTSEPGIVHAVGTYECQTTDDAARLVDRSLVTYRRWLESPERRLKARFIEDSWRGLGRAGLSPLVAVAAREPDPKLCDMARRAVDRIAIDADVDTPFDAPGQRPCSAGSGLLLSFSRKIRVGQGAGESARAEAARADVRAFCERLLEPGHEAVFVGTAAIDPSGVVYDGLCKARERSVAQLGRLARVIEDTETTPPRDTRLYDDLIRVAVDGMKAYGPDALPVVATLARHATPAVRLRGVEAIGSLGLVDDEILRILDAALVDFSADDKQREALGRKADEAFFQLDARHWPAFRPTFVKMLASSGAAGLAREMLAAARRQRPDFLSDLAQP